MINALIFLGYFSLSKISHSALISSYFDFDTRKASLVKIEDGAFDEAVSLDSTIVSYGVTIDPTSGSLYSLNEKLIDEESFMELGTIFDGEETSVQITPSDIVLDCLTSGPAGIMSLDTNGRIGTIDVNTGQWNEILSDPLPPPYTSYVLAQDCNGTVHYINGDGAYYTLKQNTTQLKKVIGVMFPTGKSAFCGDFTSDTIITAIKYNNPASEKSIVHYDIENVVVTTETITPAANFLDVTRGDASDVCDESDMPSTSPSMYPSKGKKRGKKGKGVTKKRGKKGIGVSKKSGKKSKGKKKNKTGTKNENRKNSLNG